MAGQPRCELCGARAAPLRCPGCRLTYYCDVSHQKTDWVSIHSQICHLLSPVLRPQRCFHSEKDRKDGKEQLLRKQESLIAVALCRAQGFLWAGQPLEAIPAALQALRSSSRLLGPASLRLLPIYLLLAEASTGAGRPRQAAKYLSQAQWIVLQSPDCSAALQSKLHRGLGLFSIAEGNLEQALYHLANDVYLATAEFGLNSVEVSGGYFHMANIFFHQNKMDAANSLYTEVSSLWHAWLLSSLHGHQRALQARAEASPFSEEEEGSEDGTSPSLSPAAEAQRERGARMLGAVLELREQGPLQHPGETAQILHSLAIIHYLGQDLAKAQELGMKAFDLAKQLPQQDSLETIGHLLELINAQFSHTT
ncbi:zinc finger MYND domain-containing protein 12 isoform X1 [Camarhynchus parvulus]|uniref:zinc finger MYND domain-containing protein 12 isoform X1 n=1 Tax=Geospiza parvula TaxID=87175 RepID=UPI001237C89E|nr:zinc finger MYND domain-containing protein 12 isoform X1 [Camarhynchus parvulus]